MASGGKGEKILVSVRVRPQNEKEKARNDICDWECVNNTTIVCNNNLPERSLFPSTYTFDKVFGFDSPTKQVYEDGAKEVALCVLGGINSSIFAYGQTSSGKTYTMCGITKFAMDDIFCYIQKHTDRKFTLKFSAIEIYNEAVRDLLSGDNNQRRLLDDPERGTVVEKLIEETIQDRTHLEELLTVCETQRKIGETSLNEVSSRSHQILRLTIESTGREYSPDSSSTLAASVCFIDLAGSERASQTLSAGTRLKEGCHINRSLLTLGTVIRKLRFDPCDIAQSQVENLLKSTAEERSSRMDEQSMFSSMDFDADFRRRSYDSTDLGEPSIINNLTERNFEFLENSEEDDFLLDDKTPQFSRHNLYDDWEELVQITDERLEDACKEVRCIEPEAEQSSGQPAACESHDSLDDIVDKIAISEVLSPRKEETLPGLEHEQSYNPSTGIEKAENEDMEISIPAAKEETLPALEYEQSYNSYTGNERAENEVMEISTPRKDEPLSALEYEQSYNSSTSNEKAENEDMEISTPAEKENVDLSLKTIDVNAKPETYELTLKNSDLEIGPSVEAQESQESVNEEEQMKNEERKMSPSTKQAEQCLNKEENAQSEQQSTEDCELNSLPINNQSEATVEVELTPNDAKLDEDATSRDKWESKQQQEADKDCNESSVCKNIGTDDNDNDTYMALKEKVKEMQKKIEYLMSMHTAEQQQSPSFRRDFKSPPEYFTAKRSRSCRENLLSVRSPHWFESLEVSNNTSPTWRVMQTKASPGRPNTSSISFDSGSSTSIDTRSLKDYDPEMGNSFREFVAGLEEMAKKHHSIDSTPELDYGIPYAPTKTERMEIRPESPADSVRGNENALPNPQDINKETTDATNNQSQREQVEEAKPKETDSTEASQEKLQVAANGQYSISSSDFERQQRKIIELWAACNVPLVHRTYFFLLFKGDPSDYVYMEVELRRLSFLKQTISNDMETSRMQTVKALTREKEWISKQLPKKFPWNQRIGLYQKWGVEVNSKQRSLQVAHKLWTNTQDMDHIKESASLVAKLLGFVEPSRMPKEMFGLSLLPRTENVKSSGWRFTKSFSAIRLTR
ncbi:ATP binding microtubule motor family protein [Arabidopsis thaliana]|uniref:ATP binding microtubule motor family protein n=1 Tax=Arabidopsis thaliana TaxID=3702 RepID=A0A1P8BH14_ARATH|nr:ATP binding microtubule motor family protein [Arabidopsis thaliana]ANM70874.1 ATP binding microtubule motor family protein [Arabidopsis thaliana]|eukprot:NP_001332452.1 ATP binding microtubule motor family protein [Arabidopsis thaliana]